MHLLNIIIWSLHSRSYVIPTHNLKPLMGHTLSNVTATLIPSPSANTMWTSLQNLHTLSSALTEQPIAFSYINVRSCHMLERIVTLEQEVRNNWEKSARERDTLWAVGDALQAEMAALWAEADSFQELAGPLIAIPHQTMLNFFLHQSLFQGSNCNVFVDKHKETFALQPGVDANVVFQVF